MPMRSREVESNNSPDSKYMSWLLSKHRRLKERVDALRAQARLSAAQQLEVNHLKKQKLATKDAIESMRSSNGT